MNIKHYRGRLGYFRWSDGAETGREWFSGSVFADGSLTHRATCQLDEWDVLRDITVTVDKNWTPLDCHVRIRHDKHFEGVSLFNFYEDYAECEGRTRAFGRVSQRVPYDTPPKVFTSHAVTCDAWVSAAYSHENKAQKQLVRDAMHASPTPDGSTGPVIGLWDLEIIHRGQAEVTVPAGTFVTDHYSWSVVGMPWTPLETYVFGPNRQLARLTWETLQHNFDLVEYEAF